MNFFKRIRKINIRSLFWNFYLLPFRQAVRFPISVSSNVKVTDIYRGGVVINGNVSPGMLQIGWKEVGFMDSHRDKAVLQICKGGKIICNGKVFLGVGCNISIGKNGSIEFGGNDTVTARTTLVSHRRISFGKDCLVSWDCIFMDTDFHTITKDGQAQNLSEEIKIGDRVWICCRATVLKGSEIPAGSVVAAGSCLNKKFVEENCIYAGVPARKVKSNITWKA